MILDSTILIYFVEPNYETLRTYLQAQEDTLYFSLVTKLEVLGYHKLKPEHKIQLEQLFLNASMLPISQEVITEAIRLRQQRKRSLADSIIAATALLYSLPVLTHNVADFTDIDGLQLIALADILNA
ncbi:type II toxin-antitoxin system VapC family toxin [Spirosoma fluminis]